MHNRHLRYLLLLPALVYFTETAIAEAGLPTGGKSGLAPGLSVSASNEFRLARGFDMTADIERPWNYLVNSSDIRIGLRTIYTKLRFDIEEPGRGFNPPEPVHREYLSRRTLGFENNLLSIEAGHVAAQFGRGLTLSCKEDREVELYSILDGVYGQIRHPLFTLQAIAGRPYQWRNAPISWSVLRNGETAAILVDDEADLHMRDMVAGVSAELFAPVDKALFSLLSTGSVGGGIVRYATNVGPLALIYQDTVPSWKQSRDEFYLPSITGNFSAGSFGFSAEQAWMTRTKHYFDSKTGTFATTHTDLPGSATYLSATAGLSALTATGEYKNYYYDRAKTASGAIDPFLVPPGVRTLHSWHLLSKHAVSNLMDDMIGYSMIINWQARASAVLTGTFSYGGYHGENSRITISPDSTYWEAYAEWAQEIGNRLTIKSCIDWGQLDPEQPKVTFRTIAVDLEAGPIAKRHTFGLIVESQLNNKLYFAEKDSQALKALIIRTVPAELLAPRDTIKYFDPLVPERVRSTYRQFAFNLLATISYGMSPWLSVAVTFEHATGFEKDDNVHIVSALTSPKKNYASFGISIKPTEQHTITVEYGSMSGGKKCTLGTCVDLPPFKGLKIGVVSNF